MDRGALATIALAVMLTVSGCIIVLYPSDDDVPTVQVTALERNSYGNMVLDMSGSEFMSHGFRTGDLLTITCDGFTGTAFFTMHYTGMKLMELFINYEPDTDILDMAFQMSSDDFEPGERFTVTYAGDSHRAELYPKYYAGLCAREDWMTDADFGNFRNVTTTGMAPGILYRSYNTLSDKERSLCLDSLIEDAGVRQLINLTTTWEKARSMIAEEKIANDYCISLVEAGNAYLDFASVKFLEDRGYADVFRYIADNEGPYDICCTLGKDRTGFVIYVLEALMGGTLGEMRDDYLLTYVNLYGIEKGSDEYVALEDMFYPQLIVLHDPSIRERVHSVDWSAYDVGTFDLKKDAENYLVDTLGLSEETVGKIREHLSVKG